MVLDATVVFNEIMYNPPDDESLEWVELHNQMSVDIDLSGWRIRGIGYDFPAGTVLGGGDYLVIAADPEALAAASGFADAIGPFPGSLSNGGEELELINNSDRRMDRIDYGDSGAWPDGPDGSGVSLAKIDRNLGSEPAANWTTSAQIGGTPGADNFPAGPPEGDATLVINEIPSALDAAFWVEIANEGNSPIDLGGYVLARSGGDDLRFVLPVSSLAPGELLVINEAQLGFSASSGNRLFLYTPGKDTLVDAQRVTNRLRGRSDEHDGRWLFPSAATPGAANQFDFQNDIVINEIMFHPRSQAAQSLIEEDTTPVEFEATWKFDDSGNDLGVAWREPGFNDGGWDAGQGAFFGGTIEGNPNGGLQNITTLFGSGVGENGRTLADGQADPHYKVIVSPDGRNPAGSQARVITNHPAWLANSSVSKWVGPVNPGTASVSGGQYIYETTFDMAGLSTSTASITLRFVADNQLDDVLINGVSTGISKVGFSAWGQSFIIDDGFVPGINTLRFAWTNGSGPGAFRVEIVSATSEPTPKKTELEIGPTTYYFRHEFNFDGNPQATELTLAPFVDDGAVYYLNGVEVWRENMPVGEISHSTLALASRPGEPDVGDFVTIPAASLLRGRNVLAVEVHQAAGGFGDVAFGAELLSTEVIQEARPFGETDEEWIELFNRGSNTVDLTGWRFDDGVRFDFTLGTTIAAGEYLVVARNAVELATKYPDIEIVGNFSGSLSNRGERIVLEDASGNPADEVHYYDRGRWGAYADGGGSSLELRDPTADNSVAEAWAPSDETGRAEWRTYTYRGIASNSPGNNPSGFREFVFGLLDEGELLIDDISVIERPGVAPVQFIQNGSFESDTIGGNPAAWRALGTHGSHGRTQVIVDPDDANNKVLHVVATGPTEHMHNHLETTNAGNRTVRDGWEYEVSFRAKSLGGSNLLNTRLYFNRLAQVTALDVPELSGTPGAANSRLETNIGPTFQGMIHSPVVPASGKDVTVSVTAADPHGLQSMTLRYSVNGGSFRSVTMTIQGDGRYTGIIPGQSSSRLVQFYVEGRDNNGAVSTFPAAGPDSRALYRVQDGQARIGLAHNFRIVMTAADANFLHRSTNVMSNDEMGATVVYDEQTVFYDVGVRLRSSERGRDNSARVGFNVRFQPDQLFRGVHPTVFLDRSSASAFGLRHDESIVNQIQNRAGNIPGNFSDIVRVIAPQSRHTSSALLLMSPFGDDFLDTQFENGSDGYVYKYELIYFPTTTSGGLKRPQPDSVLGVGIRSLGDNKEAYRWNFLNKNHRDEDNFDPIIRLAQTFSLTGSAFLEQVDEVIDVDQWLRAFAVGSLAGIGDNYVTGAAHNLRLYARPEDGRVLYFPWDQDFTWRSGSLFRNADLNKLVASDAYRRLYLGHVQDIVNTAFNGDYISRFTTNFAAVVSAAHGSTQNYGSVRSFISSTGNAALNTIRSQIPVIPFHITTNSGNDFATGEVAETIRGDGWVNVREIRLAGSDQPLGVEWTDRNSWQVTVPLRFGKNAITFEAYDFQGELIDTDSITIESTSRDTRVADALRITEIMFNPAQTPGGASFDNDDFEFIELQNVGSKTIDLSGVRFDNGLTFDFTGSNASSLAPGAFTVVVKNTAAFLSRYSGFDVGLIAGEFAAGNLSNGGERLTLLDEFGQAIHDFRYRDGWYDGIDGDGFSLSVRDATAEVSLWDQREGWRPSSLLGGSPGAADSLLAPDPGSIVINEILTHSDGVGGDGAGGDWIELFNTTTDRTIDVGGWLLSDDSLVLDKFQIPAGTSIAPGGFLLLTEAAHFGNADHPGTREPFGFSELGERIIVTAALPDGTPLGYRQDKTFGAAASGVTFGRHVKSTGGSDFTALATPTPEAANSLPLVGPLVIHEIFYNPADDRNEFIELKNISDAALSLFDRAAPNNTWRFTGGVAFAFPTGVTVASDDTILIVPNDPAEFRAANGVPGEIAIFGPYLGSLSNGGESLELSKPGPQEPGGAVPLILVDRVNYDDSPPWPTEADGGGAALQRRVAGAYGNDPINWAASGDGGTPGIVPPQVTGVFVSGSRWSAEFLDHLAAAGLGEAGFAIPTGGEQFDVLPWTGIDRISIRFSRDMTVGQADLTLTGVNQEQYTIAGFDYDNANFVATWTLDGALRAEKLLIDLSGEVHDVGGRGLDADWVDGSSAFPSGNDFIEGDERFRFRLNVLPGDVTLGGSVDRADLVDLIHHIGLDTGDAAFDPRRDLTGDARIDVRDLRALLLRLSTELPGSEPSPLGASQPLVAVDAIFTRLGAGSPAPAVIQLRPRRSLLTTRGEKGDKSNYLHPPSLEIRRANRR